MCQPSCCWFNSCTYQVRNIRQVVHPSHSEIFVLNFPYKHSAKGQLPANREAGPHRGPQATVVGLVGLTKREASTYQPLIWQLAASAPPWEGASSRRAQFPRSSAAASESSLDGLPLWLRLVVGDGVPEIASGRRL